jgi:hypothetical protein
MARANDQDITQKGITTRTKETKRAKAMAIQRAKQKENANYREKHALTVTKRDTLHVTALHAKEK